MSIGLMTMAWKLSLQPTQKMVLLAMTDWANDQGGSLYPSMAGIAQRASISERHAQRVVRALVAMGWLAVVGNAAGGMPGRGCNYAINVRRLREEAAQADAEQALRDAKNSAMEVPTFAEPVGTKYSHEMDETGDKMSPLRVTSETGRVTSETGRGDMGVTRSVIEPPYNQREIRAGEFEKTKHPKTVDQEKEKVVPDDPAEKTSITAGQACGAMRAAGLADANPAHPDLCKLLGDGVDVLTLVQAATEAVRRGKGYAYALAIAASRLAESRNPVPVALPSAGRAAGGRLGAGGGLQGLSFYEREQLAKRKRWEEMTGRKWPEEGEPSALGDGSLMVLDAAPVPLLGA